MRVCAAGSLVLLLSLYSPPPTSAATRFTRISTGIRHTRTGIRNIRTGIRHTRTIGTIRTIRRVRSIRTIRTLRRCPDGSLQSICPSRSADNIREWSNLSVYVYMSLCFSLTMYLHIYYTN